MNSEVHGRCSRAGYCGESSLQKRRGFAIQGVEAAPRRALEDAAINLAYVSVVSVTMLVLVVCVLLHYEALQLLSRLLLRLTHWQRRRILLLIFSVLALHIAEIWIFGVGYDVLLRFPANGALVGQQPLGFLDHVYFSAVSFTTLGLGDIAPVGPIRFLTGTEAMSGFVLVTWSASFTYLEMQRFWRNP